MCFAFYEDYQVFIMNNKQDANCLLVVYGFRKARGVDLHARWIAPVLYILMAAEMLYFKILV